MKLWKRLIAIVCTVIICFTTPGITALADGQNNNQVDNDQSATTDFPDSDDTEINVSDSESEYDNADYSEDSEIAQEDTGAEEDLSDDSTVSDQEQNPNNAGEISSTTESVSEETTESPEDMNLMDLPSYTAVAAAEVDLVEEDAEQALVGAQEAGDAPGFEIYKADSIINGIEGSGNSLYETLMSTDMIYQQLAEYAMDEKALYYSSGLWISFFDDLFKVCPEIAYEAILLKYLEFDAESAETEDTLQAAILDFSVELAKFAIVTTECTIDECNAVIKSMPEKDALIITQSAINKMGLEILSEEIDVVMTYEETASEWLEYVEQLVAAETKRQQQIEYLRAVLARVSDNEPLEVALTHIIVTYESADLATMCLEAGFKTAKAFVKGLIDIEWDMLLEAAGGSVKFTIAGIRAGASGLNVLFGTKTLSNDLITILTLYIIDSNFRDALRDSRAAFSSAPTMENAIKFNGAFDSYREFQVYANHVAKQYIYDIINSGVLTKTFAQIFFTENIETADQLTALCDSQNNNRNRIANIEVRLFDIYANKYNLTGYIDAMNGTGGEQIIPVEGIAFEEKERTVPLSSTPIDFSTVIITPENATNQQYKITSSDSSIAFVNNIMRTIETWKVGTVTLTVTSNDGNFTDTQTLIIEENSGSEEDETHKCGEHLKWMLDDDGLLTISGYGPMYDYDEDHPLWYERRNEIKRILVTSNVASIGNFAFKDCDHLESVKINAREIGIGQGAFRYCKNLLNVDFDNVEIVRGTDMSYMFCGCSNLEELDVSKFDTSAVINMFAMFYGCSNLKELDVSKFDTSAVTNMSAMFKECENLEKLDVSKFDTSNVIDMSAMFSWCLKLTSLDLSAFDTSNVTNMSNMFYYCKNLSSLDLSHFNTSQVTDMSDMFYSCAYLTEVDLCSFNTSNVTDMSDMFNSTVSLTSLDLSGFDTSNVTDMTNMFASCGSTSINLSNFNTSNVKDMTRMFYWCAGLTNLDISNFDTSNVSGMRMMFYNCKNLSSLDLSSFNTSKVNDIYDILESCNNLMLLKTPKLTNNPIELPKVLYDSSGAEYSEIPVLSKSITLSSTKNHIDFLNCTINLSATSYTYNGKARKPGVTVKNGDLELSAGTDYTVSYANNVNAGTASVTVTGTGWYTGEKTLTFQIKKAAPKLVFAESELRKSTQDSAFTNGLTKTTDGTVSFSSSNKSVATVNASSGKVTIKGPGTATISVKAAEGANYKAGTSSYTLTVTGPLEILSISDNYYGKNGSTAAFHIEAAGTGAISYQWQYRTVSMSSWKAPAQASAKTTDYSFSMKPSYDNIEVRCIVTDGTGNQIISETRKANVFAYTSQPADITAEEGQVVRFEVSALGRGITYQWYYMRPNGVWNKAIVSGSKTAVLPITAGTKNDGTSYRCVITDKDGNQITSSAGILTVETPLRITGISENAYAVNGKSVNFHIDAVGEGKLTYKWQYRTTSMSKWKASGQASARTTDYSFNMKPSYDNIEVRCVVSDEFGKEVISETRKANVFAFTSQPKDVTALQDQTVDFTVSAIGRGVTYQWYYMRPNGVWNKAIVSGSKTAVLPITAGTKNDGTSYRCVITDKDGNQITSSAGILTVETPLRITGISEDAYDVNGEDVTFHIDAVGKGNLSYQWQYRLAGESKWRTPSLASAKTADYVFKLRPSYDNIEVRCIVTDATGNTCTSDVRKAKVFAITQQPNTVYAEAGDSVTFAVEGIGQNLTYQWYYRRLDGDWKKVITAGYNTASLTITAQVKNNGSQYRCYVYDGVGNLIKSRAAMLIERDEEYEG